MPEALESAMAELVFGPPLADAAAVQACLERQGVDQEDVQAILADGVDRLLVYRKLVRGTLRDALDAAIPRTMARLGPVFDEHFDAWLRERAPRSRYLRDVTTELLDFCAPRWASDPRVPAWAMDLARHEAVQIVVASEQARPREREPGELSLDAPVRFIEAVRLMRYAFAVHRLSDDAGDRTAPPAEPTALFVYRSPEHEVRYLETSALAADILERLLSGEPLGEAIRRAASESGQALQPRVLEGTATLLADLAERGALLGAMGSEEDD